MEVLILRRGTFWISNTLDLIASFGIIYGSQFIIRGAFVSITGALITSLLILATEYVQHLLLIRSHKTQKA